MSDDRRLRTWVERVSVVAILGSSATLAVPKYASMERERIAQQVLSDVETLRTAVYAFYSDSAYFPPVVPGEPAPETLIQYLPARFSFVRPYGSLEYRNWSIAAPRPVSGAATPVTDTTVTPGRVDSAALNDSTRIPVLPPAAMAPGANPAPQDSTPAAASGATAANVIGVTVIVNDGRVGAMAAAKTAPRNARFVVGNNYTFLFFGT